MPRPSQLDRHFSQAEQIKLARFLNQNPVMSVDDFRDLLADKGLEVSRSTAHEAKQKLEAAGRHLRESRMISETLSREMGDAAVEGEAGRVLVEIVRTLAFNIGVSSLDDGNELDPKALAYLAKATKDMAHAGRLFQDFEVKADEIRDKAAADARAEAAAVVDSVALTDKGLSPETVDMIKTQILGVGRPVQQ